MKSLRLCGEKNRASPVSCPLWTFPQCNYFRLLGTEASQQLLSRQELHHVNVFCFWISVSISFESSLMLSAVILKKSLLILTLHCLISTKRLQCKELISSNLNNYFSDDKTQVSEEFSKRTLSRKASME